MKKKKIYETLDRQLAALFGDPMAADEVGAENASEVAFDAAGLAQMAYELAQRAAQHYRVSGQPVPGHIAAVLAQLKPATTLEGAPVSKLREVVDSVLNPFRGPAERLAFNYHRLTGKSERDERVLKELGEEVKRDWTKEKDEDSEQR